jgi:hypothetical protein
MAFWTSETLRAVYIRLLEREVDFVVIGGQAVNLWSRQYSICCESFLPLDSIRRAADTEPKLASFASIRWPIIETKIRDRRSRFLAIVEVSKRQD